MSEACLCAAAEGNRLKTAAASEMLPQQGDPGTGFRLSGMVQCLRQPTNTTIFFGKVLRNSIYNLPIKMTLVG